MFITDGELIFLRDYIQETITTDEVDVDTGNEALEIVESILEKDHD